MFRENDDGTVKMEISWSTKVSCMRKFKSIVVDDKVDNEAAVQKQSTHVSEIETKAVDAGRASIWCRPKRLKHKTVIVLSASKAKTLWWIRYY